MPFTVGQYLTANDLKSQEDAHTLGYGVVNGLQVVPDAPPSMTVEVEIGKAYAADTLVVKGAATDLVVGAADPANPRKDIVVCNSAGTLSIVAGTPEAALPGANVGVYTLNPEPPNIPANSIILAEIWVPAGAAAITGAEIYDKRVSIADFLTHKDATTGVHGVGAGTIAKVGDIAVDANLSAAGQDAITKRHTQNTDTDLSPAHKDATTGVHGVGASTVCSEAEADAKIAAKIKAGVVTDTTGADGKISVIFAAAFASTPLVTVQLEGDVDYYPVITAKSTTGFTVKILKTAHAHSQGNTGNEAAHTHGVSFASGAGSAHHHTVPNTSTQANHSHSFSDTSSSAGSHSHTQGATGGPSATIMVMKRSFDGRYCAATSGGPVTTSFPAWDGISSTPGSETHTHTNPNTSTKAGHTHYVSGTTGSAGSHYHTIGNTGNESAHTHSVSGNTGAGSNHSHTNPNTNSVNAGNTLATTAVTFSYIAMIP